MKEVSPSEFWIFWVLIIAARVYWKQGDVWMRSDPEGIEPVVDFTNKNMTKSRHITIKRFMYRLFADKSRKDTDPWWVISPAIKLFNDRRKTHVWSSYLKVFDESMSAYTPQSTKTGNLPHLSCILRKPEPLGSEFKVVADSVTGMLLYLELQRGKKGMDKAKYADTKKATAACCIRLAEGTVRVTNENGDASVATPSPTPTREDPIPKQTFLGDSWFTSVQAVTELALRGHHFIGVIKTNHAGYPKQFLSDTMQGWPSGSHLLLETQTSQEIDLCALGYKYNSRKVMFFCSPKEQVTLNRVSLMRLDGRMKMGTQL